MAAHIRDFIGTHGGAIGFDTYMRLALYAPGLGYYSAGATKFGDAGDFITAPEVSSLFSRCLARQVSEVLEVTGGELKSEPDPEIAHAGFYSMEEMGGIERLAPLSYELAAAALEDRIHLFHPQTVRGLNGRPPFTMYI